MKTRTGKYWKKYVRSVFMSFLLGIAVFADTGDTESYHSENDAFERKITEIAVEYENLPYKLGANPETDGAADNSHLIHKICEKAALSIGMMFSDYMPMRELLKNTYEIKAENVRNGDLIVLNNGHAALIYKVDGIGMYYCIYASERRRKVLLIGSNEAGFRQYWLQNKKGYFRFNDNMFEPVDR